MPSETSCTRRNSALGFNPTFLFGSEEGPGSCGEFCLRIDANNLSRVVTCEHSNIDLWLVVEEDMESPIIESIDGKATLVERKLHQGLYYLIMESKTNQESLFNPQQSKEINTINLEHNTLLVEHTLGKTHATLSTRKNEAISDPGTITTTELFTKPIVFSPNLEWSVDNTRGDVLYSGTLLSIFQTLAQSPGGQALRAHTFFRSGAKVQAKITSSPFHSGKLVMYYVPPGVSVAFRESIFSKVQFPCVYIDAGNSTSAELDIPFVTLKDFFATQNPDDYSDFGTIEIAVLNPLGIGTGGPTMVNYALSLHPTSNQIALPVLAHDIVLQSGILPMVAGMLPGILESSAGIAAGTTVGALGGVVADEIFSSAIQPSVDAEKRYTDSLENKNNTSSTKDLNVSAPSLSNMVGLGTEHLSLYPERTFFKRDESTGPEDFMDLQKVAQVPSLIKTSNWSDDLSPNTLLFKAQIDPMLSPRVGDIIYPTYLAHVTRPFSYWRGSIDFHFTFASTEQHKGKVIAAWVPHDSITDNISAIQPNPTVTTLSLYPNEIFDLALNKEFSFSVPYNAETPYRTVTQYYPGIEDDTLNVSDSQTVSTLGTLFVMIYNRLSHPNTVASTIQMNAYVRAGPDFQIRALEYNVPDNNYERIRYITLQSLDVAMESSRGGMLHEMANRVGRSNTQISNTSFQDDDSEHNLCKLLSKYYPQVGFSFNLAATSVRRLRFANLPGILHRQARVDNLADPEWRNLINHFRDIFAFWHGSLNYFFIHNSTVNTPVLLMASHDPNTVVPVMDIASPIENQQNATRAAVATSTQTNTEGDLSETSIYSHMSNLRVNPTIEITTPYRSIFRRLYTVSDAFPGPGAIADIDETAGSVDLVYTNPSSTDIPVSVFAFQSVGSDFEFKYLIPPPSLRRR